MTDFYSVLQRAVASLPDGSGPQRRAVYDKARKALLKQLQSFDPPLPSADVTAQRLALEDAIRKIENEIARQIRTRRAVQGAAMPASTSRPAAGGSADVPARIPPAAPAPEPAGHETDDGPFAREEQDELLQSAVSEATLPEEDVAPPVRRLAPAAPSAPVVPDDEPHPVEDARLFEDEADEDVHRTRGRRRRQEPVVEEDLHDAEYEHVEEEEVHEPLAAEEEPEEVAPARERRAVGKRGRGKKRGELKAERRDKRESRRGQKRKAVREREPNERSGRSLLSRIALPIVVLALLAGASYAALTQRDALMAVIDGLGDDEPASRAPIVADSAGSEKNTDRLPSRRDGEDTRTVTTTPWSTDGPTGNAETQVQAQPSAGEARETGAEGVAQGDTAPSRTVGEEAAPFRSDEEPQTEAEAQVAAVNPARSSETAQAAADTATGVQRAVLYEEAEQQGEPGPAVTGEVEWSMVRQSVGGGDPEPVVRANATIPQRDMEATLTIRENRDAGLPASHLIEISFDVPPDFEGGGVKNVPGIIMKEAEGSRGEPLRGAAARVSSGLFWIALSEDANDRRFNLELLATRDWIDIPILYESGRRAILTLRKGSDGFQSVDAALREWSPG
jgi:hypothetical protein